MRKQNCPLMVIKSAAKVQPLCGGGAKDIGKHDENLNFPRLENSQFYGLNTGLTKLAE